MAESWRVVYSSSFLSGNGNTFRTTTYVDFDSVERSGAVRKYRTRTKTDYGTTEDVMAASCDHGTRGQWSDMRMYPVYPDTVGGDEVKAVCEFELAPVARNAIPSRAAPTTPAPTAAPEPSQTYSSGSGFLVSPKQVVTNFHVVEGCSSIAVRQGDLAIKAEVKATASVSDLALLSLERATGIGAIVRATALLGEDIMVAGHPLAGLLANDIVVTRGQVNSLAGLLNDPGLFQFSAPIQPGNSGGPLLDTTGAVVGVVVSKVNVLKLEKVTGDMAQNVNFAIKPEVLRLFLDTNRAPYQVAGQGKRLDGIELAARARRLTVQVVCAK